ncbi:MAG: hypothetical protein ACI8XM_000301 [Haloarculaceae archaeon]|jgi:hypothetical protein
MRLITALSSSTIGELLGLSLPAGLVIGLAVWRSLISVLPVVWYLSGIGGLLVVLAVTRDERVDRELLFWPRPSSQEDVLTGLLGYNAVLLLGVLASRVFLTVSGSLIGSIVLGAFLPPWFLKHLAVLVFMDV